jgi:type I restriction enzyme R subunit
MVKERYKDESLDISDAGGKVAALINEHMVELGIDPKLPPIELLAEDFIAQVQKHSKGDPEAKAIKWTTHPEALRGAPDEDPAFYKRLSEKLEKLIQDFRNNWEALAEGYEQLRLEAAEGRIGSVEGLTKEASPFLRLHRRARLRGRRGSSKQRDLSEESGL